MRQFIIDGRLYYAYGPEEIVSRRRAPVDTRHLLEIRELTRLLGEVGLTGPLGVACRHSAEHVHRGGYRHRSPRPARA